MLSKLIENINSWPSDKIDKEVYKNLINHTDANSRVKMIVNESGLFHIRPESNSSYFDLKEGKIYRLDKSWQTIDWECQLMLYELCKERSILTDIPLHYEIVKLDNAYWKYSILKRPGENLGIEVATDFSEGLITPDYIKRWVDQSIPFLECMKEVADKHKFWSDKTLYFTSRYRINDLYAWKSPVKWWLTTEHAYENCCSLFKMHVTLWLPMSRELFGYPITDKDIEDCYRYGEQKWKRVIK